ncbi:HNH endonuclease, partial [Escherichia coli]|nr:HNH endonuclease [Escherichia coli]
MPKIKNRIRFSAESLDIIEKKLSSPDFQHTNWGDDDLQVLRAEIRNHYREEQ